MATVGFSDAVVTVPFAPLASVGDTGYYAVTGEVKTVQEPRSFTSRDGTASWVRNIRIGDGDEVLNVVLWGEGAGAGASRRSCRDLPCGGKAREVREHRGPVWGGAACSGPRTKKPGQSPLPGRSFAATGARSSTMVQNGTLSGESSLSGSEMKITGVLSGSRIIPDTAEPGEWCPEKVAERLAALVARLDALAPP